MFRKLSIASGLSFPRCLSSNSPVIQTCLVLLLSFLTSAKSFKNSQKEHYILRFLFSIKMNPLAAWCGGLRSHFTTPLFIYLWASQQPRSFAKAQNMTEPTPNIESLLSDESFLRWLTGKASDDESKQWIDWLNRVPHHHELYNKALKLWEMAHFRPASLPDVEQEWQALRRRLSLKPERPASQLRLFPRSASFGRNRLGRESWVRFGALAAAAVLVIALLWRYLLTEDQPAKQEFQVASTGYGERARIILPDSTTIILNAHSTLRYPAVWTAAMGHQFELQGEAYFEVASHPEGPQHDFIVHTSDGNVKVVGTNFVVYDRGQGTRVVVKEGGVEVTVSDTSSVSTVSVAKVILRSGNLLQFQKGSRTLAPQLVNIGLYTTWWRDHLVLEDTPFEKVIHRLEETYGIHVEVKDERVLKRTLSGSVENRNLDVITEALAKALGVTVSREGQVVVFGNLPKGRRNP